MREDDAEVSSSLMSGDLRPDQVVSLYTNNDDGVRLTDPDQDGVVTYVPNGVRQKLHKQLGEGLRSKRPSSASASGTTPLASSRPDAHKHHGGIRPASAAP